MKTYLISKAWQVAWSILYAAYAGGAAAQVMAAVRVAFDFRIDKRAKFDAVLDYLQRGAEITIDAAGDVIGDEIEAALAFNRLPRDKAAALSEGSTRGLIEVAVRAAKAGGAK